MDTMIKKTTTITDEESPDSLQVQFVIEDEQEQKDYILYLLGMHEEQGIDSRSINDLCQINKSFRFLWNLFSFLKKPFTIIREDQYVDRVFRDSFYYYYSHKHFPYERNCSRIFLFDFRMDFLFSEYSLVKLNNGFIGTVTIRPLPELAIGRSLLNPGYFLTKYPAYIRLGKYHVTCYGRKLTVRAFPFSMQDGETTTCAEITVLNIFDYYGQTYSDYHFILPSDIKRMAERFNFERSWPAKGLRYEALTRIFTEAEYFPRLYSIDKIAPHRFRQFLHYYIESGIPVAIGFDIDGTTRHSVIGIGHGKTTFKKKELPLYATRVNKDDKSFWFYNTSDMVNDYCIMDDNRLPYTIFENKKDDKTFSVDQVDETQKSLPIHNIDTSLRIPAKDYHVNTFMVPLHRHMYLEAGDAYDIIIKIAADTEAGIRRHFPNVGKREFPAILRIFMASSKTFRKVRHKHFESGLKNAQAIYDAMSFPRFIWVCEIFTEESYSKEIPKAIGEIVIDATASPDMKMKSYLLLHYGNEISVHNHHGSDIGRNRTTLQFSSVVFKRFIGDKEEFDSYTGNLYKCKKYSNFII